MDVRWHRIGEGSSDMAGDAVSDVVGVRLIPKRRRVHSVVPTRLNQRPIRPMHVEGRLVNPGHAERLLCPQDFHKIIGKDNERCNERKPVDNPPSKQGFPEMSVRATTFARTPFHSFHSPYYY